MTNANVTENQYKVTVSEGVTTVVTAKAPGPQGADAVLQAGDRGDFTVSVANNGAQTAVINSGVINNDKVAGDAAIHGSKINPSFGDQSIFTNGNLNIQGGLFTLAGSTPAIQFNDNEDNPDFRLVNSNGVFKIRDNTNGADRIKINTDGHVDITSHLDCFSGLDVTGEIHGTSHIDLPNNAIIKLGNDDEFQLLHNSSNGNSIIRETGGGILSLQTNGSQTSFWDSTNQVLMAEFNTGGSCTFRHGATTRLATSSTGINVTGDISVSGTVDSVDLSTYQADGGSYLRSDADDTFTGTLTANSDGATPIIKVQGNGPNFIRFATDAGGTVDADSIDLVYRATPNTLGFERASDSAVMFSVDADDQRAIFNGNVNANAALNVTGNITTNGILIIQNSFPRISLIDDDNDSDYDIRNSNGGFAITDQTNLQRRFLLNNSGNFQFGNGTVASNVDITGNLTIGGTVDGVDIAARNTLFGALTSSSGVLTDGVTGTTQSASDNSTKIATTSYVDTAVANLVNSAPATLDTLGEIATELGNQESTATALANSIAAKLPLAGGTLSGNLTISKQNAIIALNDPDTSDPNYEIRNDNGILSIADSTNSATKIQISKTTNLITIFPKISANGGIALQDNDQIQLGTDLDCKIYHSGTNGYINNSTGDFIIQKSNTDRLAVNATGIDVTGQILSKSTTGTGSTGLKIDNSNETFVQYFEGGGADATFVMSYTGSGGTDIRFKHDGEVSLRHAGQEKLKTTQTGVAVTGKATMTESAAIADTNLRKITTSTSAPTSSDGGVGDIWIVYPS